MKILRTHHSGSETRVISRPTRLGDSHGAPFPGSFQSGKSSIGSAPFNYEFLDDDYAGMFREEERIGTLASVFSSLAILISCIGIFGLASFATIQRAREIGIRKVLGASVSGLWKMLPKDFLLLVVAAIVLGIPLAWYLSLKWLQQYEYRTDLSWMIFLLTGVIAMSITIVTVSFETLRAELANPVRALKSE